MQAEEQRLRCAIGAGVALREGKEPITLLKIYGSAMCPDCRECKANFDANSIAYEFVDINEKLRNLKEFLDLRDHLPVFDHCKEIGDIGLPALQREDGTVFLNWEDYLKEQGLPVVYKESGEACSIDGKGC